MIFTNYSSKNLAAAIEQLGQDELLQNILVPVDFSECSNNAIRFAVAIAIRTGATIKLFHSVQVPLQAAEMHAFPINDLEREAAMRLGETAVEIMHWLEKERFRKLVVLHKVSIGFAAEEVARQAAQDKTDLIVMGTQGSGALEGVILGSNASAVIQYVKCPVMVVPENAEFEGCKRICYATDMREINTSAIKMLVDFATHFEAEIHVLHVLTSSDKLGPEQANIFKDQFSKAAAYEKVSYHIVDAEDQTVAHTIEAYLDEHEIDAVAMITHHRSFFDKLFHPSVTKKLAVHAFKPLLAFH